MRQILLLRGINLGPRNRIAMAALRGAFAGAGFPDAGTYLQSGNVVLSSDVPTAELARESERILAREFGLQIAVIARTHDELAAVVERDPPGELATDPKRYPVSFLADELAPESLSRLSSLATPSERLVAAGRELYAWHPDGVARSKLWAGLAGSRLGVASTARNWNTVTALLALADG